MQILSIVISCVLALTSILLTSLVLFHKGQGGGMSDVFGGGVSSSLNSSGVAQRNLNRLTVTVAVIWAVAIVALALMQRFAAAA
ncbi:preprotein translocase subunit SecG [Falsarthrobacter nasiphocae]|uniref:Protein-export membrane protein SecG n=1 Tax=Falsarthrobacter nasiphocae TaxID=189863 RepID=A0AAE4C558_9MICC|nr:preprotein translocase subunit SecG [Falsarthrobacter nasiphocae]MDR6891158.1 preprotein translocase subunit SecG [Falsarthrobacter nasiphocae]